MFACFIALATIGASPLPYSPAPSRPRAPASMLPQAKKVQLHDPATLKADFNAAAGVPRVVIILSPS